MFSSTSPATVRSKAGAILRVTSGNFLEQFDFFLFGFYATYIAHTFFPASSEFASLMMTFAVFGAGFLMRPIGAIVLGAYIDKVRLAIAQTILNSPEILIFDEPSAGLDPFEREQFKRIMVKLKETSIIIISTHIVSDIDTITDDLIILNKGSVIANDSPDVLFEHIRGMVWDIPKADIGLLPIENIYYEDTKSKTISKTKPTPNAVMSEPTMNDLYFCGQLDGGVFE